MILLVTGGRNYSDRAAFHKAMAALPFHPSIIIEGGAGGADRMAREWAKVSGAHHATVPALWDEYGKGAGPKRNTAMLLLKPDYCLAFPGGRGTADMMRKCERAGVTVWAPYGVRL